MREIELTPQEAANKGIIEPMDKDGWYIMNGLPREFKEGDLVRIQIDTEVNEISNCYELKNGRGGQK